jgi:hypothetical protein
MRHRPDLSLRQETFSPRARNRSGSDVRVTRLVRRIRSGGASPSPTTIPTPTPRSCRGFHIDNRGVEKFTRNARGLLSLTRISDLSLILNLTTDSNFVRSALRVCLEIKAH